MTKAFAFRIGVDEATTMFGKDAFENMIGKEVRFDDVPFKVLDAVVLQGGFAAELMLEQLEEDCDCLPVEES